MGFFLKGDLRHPHSHEPVVGQRDLVAHGHGEGGLLEYPGADIEGGCLKRREGVSDRLADPPFRLLGPGKPAHELEDQDLPLLLKKVVPLLGELQLTLKSEKVRFCRRHVELCHVILTALVP